MIHNSSPATQVIADFHTHSRFARACSKFLTLPSLDNWARAKGTNLLGTSDFTHPVWFAEIQEQLENSTDAKVVIWAGSCYGACDAAVEAQRLGVDLLIQWGHAEWR